MTKLNWSKAKTLKSPTETIQSRKLDYRADRYLEVVEMREAAARDARVTRRKTRRVKT